MSKSNKDKIYEIITKMHEGDTKQLSVIFSDEPKIMVEAPAGYGKTTTMISRLAYLIAMNTIPYPKKILALTFSINAALKIKKDVAEKLPALLGVKNNPNYVTNKFVISNYHGFCKSVLKKYGYLLSPTLKTLDELQAIGDEEISKLPDTKAIFSADENIIISKVNDSIKESQSIESDMIDLYNQLIIQKLLPLKKITHNAIILLTLQLFRQHKNIKNFSRKFFSLIVIDEYQDTNIIAWNLIDELVAPNTKLLLMGDPLQRIYGFIGAYPNIMKLSAKKYAMQTIVLDKNYRFRNNAEMLKLDNNVRKNAANFNMPNITENALLPYHYAKMQTDEAEWIANHVNYLLKKNPMAKIAVLVRNRGINTDIIETKMKENDIDYFYALYKDDDEDYVDFHRKCLELFIKTTNKKSSLSRKVLMQFVNDVKTYYDKKNTEVFKSLLLLLETLMKRVYLDYSSLEIEDRKALIRDIFENRQLKQAMEYIPANVIFSTVHGAKGLEWDFVILADVEKWITPFFTSCRYCLDHGYSVANGLQCKIIKAIDTTMSVMLLEELCVFYVAITRARQQVFITSSGERFNYQGKCFNNSVLSCLPSLPGIQLSSVTYDAEIMK